MNFYQCYLIANNCYRKGQSITPRGIIVHSTGVNNKQLKRYVQPLEGQMQGVTNSAAYMVEILGRNIYDNHWNHFFADNQQGREACVHAFIGKLANGNIAAVQTLPFNMRAWGCGAGNKGSYNNSHIQFEICEDDLTSKAYFLAVMDKAAELCAYLCKKYRLAVSSVISHHEAHVLGYASDHSDIDHWLQKFGYTMHDFRTWVEQKTKEGAHVDNEQYELINKRLDALEKALAPAITKYKTAADVSVTGKATIEKLIAKKYLNGDNGDLKLSEQMIRLLVILDRAGLFE